VLLRFAPLRLRQTEKHGTHLLFVHSYQRLWCCFIARYPGIDASLKVLQQSKTFLP